MKKLVVFITLIFLAKIGLAQTGDFKEGQPLVIEGVEFLYTLGLEEVKMIDSIQYSFFNVNWYITNKGKFSKIFLIDRNSIEDPEYDMAKKAYLGKIHVINSLQVSSAKRFDVMCSEPNMEVVLYEKGTLGIGTKRKTVKGFNLQSGQTLSSNITVAVRKGVQPNVFLQPFLSRYY